MYPIVVLIHVNVEKIEIEILPYTDTGNHFAYDKNYEDTFIHNMSVGLPLSDFVHVSETTQS